MAEQIRDGSGGGFLAKVDSNQRLHVQSVITTSAFDATDRGASYNVNTGVITLTNAVDTPVLYLKNNETEHFHITAIAVGLGPSTGGSGNMPQIHIIRNPTTGTIIESTPTNVDIVSNRNYGSSTTFDADAYKGATGDTMTNGSVHIIFFQGTSGRLFAPIDEVINRGDSIGIRILPQAGNSSMQVYAALIGHLTDIGA